MRGRAGGLDCAWARGHTGDTHGQQHARFLPTTTVELDTPLSCLER